MIPVESILYKVDQKLNKLSSNEHQQIPLEDKILLANEAQLRLVKSKFDTEDTRRLGLDAFLKRYQDLEGLVVSWKLLPLADAQSPLKQFTGDLTKLDPKLLLYIDSYVIADKGLCRGKIVYSNLVKHGDVTTLLRNAHYKPSFEYQDTLVTLSAHQLEVYTDGTFTPTTASVSYLRYPAEIDYEGYEKLDGTASVTQHCELPAYLEDELIDVIVQLVTAALVGRNQPPQ